MLAQLSLSLEQLNPACSSEYIPTNEIENSSAKSLKLPLQAGSVRFKYAKVAILPSQSSVGRGQERLSDSTTYLTED